MKRTALPIILVLGLLIAATQAAHAGQAAAEARLVSGIRALDPAITAVRPASVHEPGRGRFSVVWLPAVTIRNGTPIETQLAIAQKVAAFVVAFQGGVPTEDVLGGIVAFIEGEGWNPEIGQVYYRVEKPARPVEVGVGVRIVDEGGNASCCEDVDGLGTIAGKGFQAKPAGRLVPEIRAAIAARKE